MNMNTNVRLVGDIDNLYNFVGNTRMDNNFEFFFYKTTLLNYKVKQCV